MGENKNEKILAQMDETLDQLITNAKVIQHIPKSKLEAHEWDALQRTQDSLLAHLMHLDKALNEEITPKKPLQEKATEFQGLNQNLQKRFNIKRRKKTLKK